MLVIFGICVVIASVIAIAASIEAEKNRKALDSYKESYGNVIGQLQAAQDENLSLSTQMLDATVASITDEQMMQFIVSNNAKFTHQWIYVSTGEYKGLGPKKYIDRIISERCSCCGMVRRYWRDGDGNKYMKGYAGTFLGNKEIVDEFRQVVCIGKLPLEFMQRKNSDVVRELVAVNEPIEVSFEELLNRSKK